MFIPPEIKSIPCMQTLCMRIRGVFTSAFGIRYPPERVPIRYPAYLERIYEPWFTTHESEHRLPSARMMLEASASIISQHIVRCDHMQKLPGTVLMRASKL